MRAPLAKQLLLLGLAASLWSVAGEPSLLMWLAAYGAGWILFELPWSRRTLAAAKPNTLVLLAVALAAPGVAFAYRSHAELAQREGVFGSDARLRDRLRLDAMPAIAPPLWAADRPQTWFVAAPDAPAVTLRAAGVRALEAESLGGGLFRIDYDPRRDGVPKPPAGSETLRVQLHADGRSVEREMYWARPLAHPRWFCVASDRSRAAAVSEETDELFVLDRTGVTRRAVVGDGPADCAFTDPKSIAIAYRHQRTLEIRDAGTGEAIHRLELPATQSRVTMSPSGSLLAVALGGAKPELAIVHLSDRMLTARVPLRHSADWLRFGADDETLVVAMRASAELVEVRGDGRAYREGRSHALGRPAVTLARTRGGSQLWAATTDRRAAGHAQLGNHFVQDQLLCLDSASFRLTERRLTAERSERQSKPGDFDRGISPMGVHEARDGSLWVTFAGSDELWRLRLDQSPPDHIDLVDAGLHAPHGIAELADGTLLVSSPVAGAFGVIAPGARTPKVVRVTPDDDWLLRHDRAALARRVGERGFYESTRSGISCQSCHMHADSDDAAYNLGDRQLLPTLTVRGLAGTAPYLRDGSYARLRDLDDVAQRLYRGYLRNQAARGETLEAFVRALPRRGNLRPRDIAAERRGYAAFRKAQCDRCHAPPAFTNLAQLPQRLLFPERAGTLEHEEWLDTPALLSAAATPPYLNDGRAQTLDAVLVEHNPNNRHGDVQRLNAAERHDLVTFLSSL